MTENLPVITVDTDRAAIRRPCPATDAPPPEKRIDGRANGD
jgi:hypothetical protein